MTERRGETFFDAFKQSVNVFCFGKDTDNFPLDSDKIFRNIIMSDSKIAPNNGKPIIIPLNLFQT
jgi:hypothetical protein